MKSYKLQLRSVVSALLCCALLGIAGCGGCTPETPAERAAREANEKAEKEKKEKEREEKEKEEKKPPFEIGRPLPKPSEVGEKADGITRVKPGHWMTATQRMIANDGDWVGETQMQVVDGTGNEIDIKKTPYTLASSRPVRLSKGRERQIENLFFVPEQEKRMQIESVLRERNYGSERRRESSGLVAMQPYEYFFVVLSKEPQRYIFLKSLNAVDSYYSDVDSVSDSSALYYRILLPDITNTESKQIPLPENPLCWSTMAYVLWDEVDPEQLDRPRREALVDWLHWGGQLIVNGPDSLRLLKDSFLSPYLPATDGGARTLIAEDVAPLNDHWSYGKNNKTLKPTKPWSGINLTLTEGGQFVERTGELFAEKRVGRGRIVVSAMQISERDLLTWSPHYDNLFNACLLRRPGRKFTEDEWNDGKANCMWADRNLKNRRLDAALSTNFRLFARDVHADDSATNVVSTPIVETFESQRVEDFSMAQERISVTGGVGAWNNFNATSNSARESLREAAGVQVPKSQFVIICLAVYLTVLVPLNWAFFRALNRVEYAWVAAPLIALVGTAVVVKQAQLDIGFVRAQTEIALLELQGDHQRGHLSRYTALYTSLGTSYDLEYENNTALAAPFPGDEQYTLLSGQSLRLVEISRNTTVKLQDMQVSSATTDMVHSEEMLPLEGGVEIVRASDVDRISNGLGATLKSAAIVRRDEDGTMSGFWLGTIDVDKNVPFRLEPIEMTEDTLLFAEERVTEADADSLNLEPMFRLALDPKHFELGETRLVGRIDRVMPGLNITPKAPQIRGATLVVAHLDYGALPSPTKDSNSPRDVMTTRQDDFDSEVNLFEANDSPLAPPAP